MKKRTRQIVGAEENFSRSFPVFLLMSLFISVVLMWSSVPFLDAERAKEQLRNARETVLVQQLEGMREGDIVHYLYGDDRFIRAKVRYVYPSRKKAIVEVASREEEELVLKAEMSGKVIMIKGQLKEAVEQVRRLVEEGDHWLERKTYGKAIGCYEQATAIEVHLGYHNTTKQKLTAAKSLEKEFKISTRLIEAEDVFKQKKWQNAISLCKQAIDIYQNFSENELAILGYTDSDVQEGIQYCNEVADSIEECKLEEEVAQRKEEKLFTEWCIKFHIPIAHTEARRLKTISDKRKEEHPKKYCKTCDGTGVTECPKCQGMRRLLVIDCKYCQAGKVTCSTCSSSGRVTCDKCGGKGSKITSCPSCHGDGLVNCSKCRGTGSAKCRKCRGKGKKTCPECIGGRIKCPVCGGSGEVVRVSKDGYLYRDRCLNCKGRGRVNCLRCGGTSRITCTRCDGSGKVSCSKCHGKGSFVCRKCEGTGKTSIPCPKCYDRGKVACSTCKGTGKMTCPHCHGRYGHTINCSVCGGKGITKCPYCSGTGLIMVKGSSLAL